MKLRAKHYAKFLMHIIEFSFYNPKKYVLPSPFSEEEILAQSVIANFTSDTQPSRTRCEPKTRAFNTFAVPLCGSIYP